MAHKNGNDRPIYCGAANDRTAAGLFPEPVSKQPATGRLTPATLRLAGLEDRQPWLYIAYYLLLAGNGQRISSPYQSGR